MQVLEKHLIKLPKTKMHLAALIPFIFLKNTIYETMLHILIWFLLILNSITTL